MAVRMQMCRCGIRGLIKSVWFWCDADDTLQHQHALLTAGTSSEDLLESSALFSAAAHHLVSLVSHV